MPAVKFFARLDLDQICLFLDGHCLNPKLSFILEAFDDQDQISRGTHDRFIIDAEKFNAAVAKKQAAPKRS